MLFWLGGRCPSFQQMPVSGFCTGGSPNKGNITRKHSYSYQVIAERAEQTQVSIKCPQLWMNSMVPWSGEQPPHCQSRRNVQPAPQHSKTKLKFQPQPKCSPLSQTQKVEIEKLLRWFNISRRAAMSVLVGKKNVPQEKP